MSSPGEIYRYPPDTNTFWLAFAGSTYGPFCSREEAENMLDTLKDKIELEDLNEQVN